MNQNKFSEFLKISRALNNYGITPLLMGSLGLEFFTRKNWDAQDIDIHIPGDTRGWEAADEDRIFNWAAIVNMMAQLGYQLIDLHEHEFSNGWVTIQYGVMDTLPEYANTEIKELRMEVIEKAIFYVPTAEQFLKIYTASSKDSYRNDKNNNKDFEKIKYLKSLRKRNTKIRFADSHDYSFLSSKDKHINADRLNAAIKEERVLIIEEDECIGWLRFSYFWESIPFIDMLYILEPFRNKAYGTALINFFEENMKLRGYNELMTSTASEEYAQHVYHKLGFETVGGFFPPKEAYEIILTKSIM